MKTISSCAEFEALTAKSTVLVDFFATWCGPCKAFQPTLEELAAAFPHVVFAKVDVDAAEEIAERQRIQSMPTFKLFAGGREVGVVTGADEDEVRELLLQASAFSGGAPSNADGAQFDSGDDGADDDDDDANDANDDDDDDMSPACYAAWEAALEPFDLAAALKLTVRPAARTGDTEVVGGATRVRARFHQLSSAAYPRDREYYAADDAYVAAVTKFRRLALAFRVLTTAERCRIYLSGGYAALRASEAYAEESIFDADPEEVYRAFWEGDDEADREYLLLNGPQVPSDDDDDDDDEIMQRHAALTVGLNQRPKPADPGPPPPPPPSMAALAAPPERLPMQPEASVFSTIYQQLRHEAEAAPRAPETAPEPVAETPPPRRRRARRSWLDMRHAHWPRFSATSYVIRGRRRRRFFAQHLYS